MPLNVGSRLGHYDVTALIGEGGMGQAYQAANIAQGRMMGVLVPTGPASTIGTPPVRDVRLTTFPEPMTARWSIKES